MRIAIDASRTTVAKVTGTEHYALRLIQSLILANNARTNPHRLDLYFRDEPAHDLLPPSDSVHKHVIPFPRLWTHWRFARELWRSRPDVTFVPAHSLPFVFPGKCVVTVHDLGYRYFPEAHPQAQRIYLDWTTRYSQFRATNILADSQATADDLHKFYGTAPEKIHVVYPGVDAELLRGSMSAVSDVRAKYKLPDRYFVFIGTLQPRKNIARIIQAFAQWQAQSGDRQTALVLAGAKGWLFDDQWLEGVENVILTGYIDAGDKGALLAGAIALVFPSLYEGFGFPVIEAMHCATPVIASNTSSLPELVGEAGLLVDPADVAAIANAMSRYAQDTSLRQAHITAGGIQAQKYSWEKAAQQCLDVLELSAGGIPPKTHLENAQK